MNCFPKVVVVLLNYNQNEYTLKCVESLLASRYPNFEILLIDNGSRPSNTRALRNKIDKRVNLCEIKNNRGYVGGINYGLEKGKKLKPDYFLIMNNDTKIDPDAIGALVETSQQFDNKCIVSGKVYHYDDPNRLQYIGSELASEHLLLYKRIGFDEYDSQQYEQVAERDKLDDIFWLFPIELYHTIGGYSPDFFFNGESSDFALRAKENGYKLIFTPKAKLWHKGSASIGGRNNNPRLEYWDIQSTLILHYLHLNFRWFLLFYLRVLLRIAKSVIVSARKLILCKGGNFIIPYAQFRGLMYFNRWMFIRTKNDGKTPFDN